MRSFMRVTIKRGCRNSPMNSSNSTYTLGEAFEMGQDIHLQGRTLTSRGVTQDLQDEKAVLGVETAKRCCGCESSDNKFKYYNNKKNDQPQYKCANCKKLFMPGLHGHPHGKTYLRKRGEDPVEWQRLDRQCPHCKVMNDASFKYYNNASTPQPRFKCWRHGLQFQMHLVIENQMRRLVPTSELRLTSSIVKEPIGCAPSNVDTDYSWPPSSVMNCENEPCENHGLDPVDEDAIASYVQLLQAELMSK